MVFIFPQQWNIALVVQPFDQSRLRTDPPYGRHCCRCCSDAAWALFFKSPQQQIIAQFSFFEWGQQIQQMESKWWCSVLNLGSICNGRTLAANLLSCRTIALLAVMLNEANCNCHSTHAIIYLLVSNARSGILSSFSSFLNKDFLKMRWLFM